LWLELKKILNVKKYSDHKELFDIVIKFNSKYQL
jgi:hypothetical protein